ncbi:MFS transporter [Frankia sp. Cj3]|uniref:MFS transporter n=1 Tax=Frankia sp. Cj3 TaxID=2880976 RepID=UPI001EF47E15|nr:MFS transporter [Frankia sp. Cj3]
MTAGVDGRRSSSVTFAALSLSALTFSLLQTMIAPALPTIRAEFGASQAGIAWIMTAYLLSASVATPILGRLGDVCGKKRVLVVMLAVLGIGTVIAALATSLPVMLFARVVQGVGGAIFPLAFGIIRDEFSPEKVGSAIGVVSAVLGVGSGTGTVISGPISSHLGYHWLFWLPAMAIAVALVTTMLRVPESPVRVGGNVSVTGALLLAAWLVALLLGISQGPRWGWESASVLGLFALAGLLIALWLAVESRSAEPLVDMRMMRIPTVYRTNITAVLFGFTMFSVMVFVPQFVETPRSAGYGFGASITAAGLYMVPASVFMLVAGIFAGRIGARYGTKIPLLLGTLIATSATSVLTFAHSQSYMIYIATSLLGVGIGLGFAAMSHLVVVAVRPDQTGIASGMNANIRTIGGSIGTTVTATVIAAGAGAGKLPHESGYTNAFLLMTAGLAVAVVAAASLPNVRPSSGADGIAVAAPERMGASPVPRPRSARGSGAAVADR